MIVKNVDEMTMLHAQFVPVSTDTPIPRTSSGKKSTEFHAIFPTPIAYDEMKITIVLSIIDVHLCSYIAPSTNIPPVEPASQ